MGIQRIEIRGYRSLRRVCWEPSRLNVLIGPNGSGKSNLLRALQLIATSARGGLGRAVLKAGGMIPLVWDGVESQIEWGVKCDPADPRRDAKREAPTYCLVLSRIGKGGAYRVENELLGNYARVEAGEKTEPLKFLERTPHRAVVFDPQERVLTAHPGTVPDEETLLSLISGPFSNPVITAFRRSLGEWGIYHDLHVDQEAPIRQAAVAHTERRVAPDGQNLIAVLHTLHETDRDFKRDINAAMTAAFGDDFDELTFPPAEDQRIQLRLRWKSLRREQSAADLSDGTIRFLLLLTILASPDPPTVIAIDEPETGLHPGMFPIVAEFATEAASRTQVILTTHSPQFLDAFRDEAPSVAVLMWINGQTELRVLEAQELARWLREYSLGSMFLSGELETIG